MIECSYCGATHLAPQVGKAVKLNRPAPVTLVGGLCELCRHQKIEPGKVFESDLERYQGMLRMYLQDIYNREDTDIRKPLPYYYSPGYNI